MKKEFPSSIALSKKGYTKSQHYNTNNKKSMQ